MHRFTANLGFLVGGLWLGFSGLDWKYHALVPAWALGYVAAVFGLLGLLGVVNTHEGTYLDPSLDSDPAHSYSTRWGLLWRDPVAFFSFRLVSPPPPPEDGP